MIKSVLVESFFPHLYWQCINDVVEETKSLLLNTAYNIGHPSAVVGVLFFLECGIGTEKGTKMKRIESLSYKMLKAWLAYLSKIMADGTVLLTINGSGFGGKNSNSS